jgi:hypothetical protein
MVWFVDLEKMILAEEENHQIKYKTLTWPLVTVLMITEIVWHPHLD